MSHPAFRVSVAFSRKDPATGKMVDFEKGDLLADPDLVAALQESGYSAHGHMVMLDDDHHAVLPHLAEDHPVLVEHMKMLEAGQGADLKAAPGDGIEKTGIEEPADGVMRTTVLGDPLDQPVEPAAEHDEDGFPSRFHGPE